MKCTWILTGVLALGGSSIFAADAARGRQVFEQCKVCHATNTPTKKVGPSLMHLFRHTTLKNGRRVTERNVRQMIERGGNSMPAYGAILSPPELDQVVAYLKTL